MVGPRVDVSAVNDRLVIQEVLEASDIPYRHDRQLLHNALEKRYRRWVKPVYRRRCAYQKPVYTEG